MASKLVQLKNKEGENITPAIGGDQLSATVPLNLGGTGSTTLGQQVGLIAYGNNGSSLETIGTQQQGFLYSYGGGKALPDFVNIADYIVEAKYTTNYTTFKLSGGLAIWIGQGTTSFECTTPFLGGYESKQLTTMATFPSGFFKSVMSRPFIAGSTSNGGFFDSTVASISTLSGWFVNGLSGTRDVTWSAIVIGKWK